MLLEAWAEDLAGCLEEAVTALTSTYVEVDSGAARTPQVRRIGRGPVEDQLLALLDEVVFVLDTGEGVPVAAEVRRRDDGGLDVVLSSVARDQVVGVGSVPKAIARSELGVVERPGRVWCRFLVDV